MNEFTADVQIIDGQGSFAQFIVDHWPHLVLAPVMVGVLLAVVVATSARNRRRPLDRLASELDEIAAGDVERQITVPPHGGPIHTLASSADAAHDHLLRSVRANERLLADAAHELRSPFTVVRGVLQLEAMEGDRPALRNAIDEVDRANRVLDDLLLLATITSHSSQMEAVDADDVVIAEIGRLTCNYPDVDVERQLTPVRIEAVGESMKRIVWNLLDNAAKYGRGVVRVTLQQLDEHLVLRVDDNGTGIPSGEVSRIRQRFERSVSTPRNKVDGVGLGLAIVDEIVTSHNGTFELASSPLGGCQVTVTMPLRVRPPGRSNGAAPTAVDGMLGRRRPQVRTLLAFAAMFLVASELTVLATYWSVTFNSPESASAGVDGESLARSVLVGPGEPDLAANAPDPGVGAEVSLAGGSDEPGDDAGPTGTNTTSANTATAPSTASSAAPGTTSAPGVFAALEPSRLAATASHSSEHDPASYAVDGDPGTRWSSGENQGTGMWFQVDLGEQRHVRRVELVLSRGYATDFPRSFRVDLADTEASLTVPGLQPVVVAAGADGRTVVEFEPQVARLIRISLEPPDEPVDSWWSISEVVVVAA